MSGVFNVFLKWAPKDRTQTAAWARHFLVFANRYEADEFYRLMQTVTQPGTSRLMFEGLERPSPQFWCHSGLLWTAPHDIQALGLANAFQSTLASTLLNDGQAGGRSFELITNPTTGPDWRSGATFFIRNRRQPNLYWCAHGSHIHTNNNNSASTADGRRTKFRIELANRDSVQLPEGQEVYFVRGDSVVISVVGEASSAGEPVGERRWVGIDSDDGDGGDSRLALVKTAQSWRFGDLVNGRVGVRWEDSSAGDSKALLVLMTEGGWDEWELC